MGGRRTQANTLNQYMWNLPSSDTKRSIRVDIAGINVTHHIYKMKISIDPVFVTTNECIAVTSAMRKNTRWAKTGVASILAAPIGNGLVGRHHDDSSDDNLASKLGIRAGRHNNDQNEAEMENPLMNGFAKLRADLAECKDFRQFDIEELLSPFLEVVRSQSTTGTITLVALNSIGKFFALKIINRDSVGLKPALHNLSDAITHCRFEATDQNEDDAVLLKILSLMEEVVCSKDHGELLADSSVSEIVETCLSMACQMRRGDVLRRAAEMTMIRLSHAVFSNLHHMEPEKDEQIVDVSSGGVKMQQNEKIDSNIEDIGSKITVAPEESATEDEGDDQELKPYGIKSIKEVFRVLVSILDPANMHQYTDSTRGMALRLINVAFEVAGKEITKHASLLNITTNKLCKHLLQLVRLDNPPLLQAALQCISTLLHTNRQHLKLQQEFFFTYLLTTLSPTTDIPREPNVDKIFYDGVPNIPKLVRASTHPVRTQTSTPVGGRSSTPVSHEASQHLKSPDSREIMVESITGLARIPSFFTDLFVNYDCDVDRTDLCEDLIGFLCRNAYPDTAEWSTASVPPLCLEAVLALLGSLVNNIHHDPPTEQVEQKVDDMITKKKQKQQAILVAEAFNEKPKVGISMMVSKGIVSDDSPESIAKWLKQSGRINKKALGDYLSASKNRDVMHKFIEEFDFGGMRLDEALREFLSTFRLPGESQLIEKLMEKFANQYTKGEGNMDDVASEDAVFILSYAIIMLNTDQHNAQNKRRMTPDDFKRNLRGANDGQDFRDEYLEDIYKTIKSREIIMPDEHDNEESFEFAWKSLLLNTSQAGELMTGDESSCFAFDSHVFELAWKPVVTTLAFVFATAEGDAAISRVITAFDQVARLAAHYKIDGVIDHIVECLSRMSTLGAGDQSAPKDNTEIQIEGEKARITVSELSVPFGDDVKAQVASVLLFRVVRAHAKELNQSWDQVLPAIANLYLYSLINSPFSTELEQKYGLEPLSGVKPIATIKRHKGGREVGLFSAISKYISGTDQAAEPTDEEVDRTLSTIDCIKSCQLDELFEVMKQLEGESLANLIAWINANLPKLVDQKQAYYPVSLFYLEMATALCHGDDDSTVKVWSTLNTYLKNWQSFSPEFLMRVLAYSLIVIMHGNPNSDADAMEHELGTTLNNILGINVKLLRSSKIIAKPVTRLLESWTGDLVVENTEYWSLLGHVAVESGTLVYESVSKILDTKMTSENFEQILNVLAAVCAASANEEQQALDVLKTIYEMADKIDKEKWDDTLWYPYLQVLSVQCAHPNRHVRDQALKYLQRLLLEQHSSEFDWQAIFERAMFPLISSLLRPEVFEMDPKGMSSTRCEVASLLCKVFLRCLEAANSPVLQLWIQILDTLDRLVNSGQRDMLRESVEESLKNVLLVAASLPEIEKNEDFWKETWKRIDEILPGLHDQVFPPPAPSPVEEKKDTEKQTDTSADKAEETPAAAEESPVEKTAESEPEPSK